MVSKLLVESAENLKKAVPLMLKHKVPTTPLNYALWYAYVSEQLPLLNKKLDKAVTKQNIYTPVQASALYREFLAEQTESDTWALRNSVDKMLLELDKSLIDTHKDTNDFQQSFEKTFGEINNVVHDGLSVEEMVNLLKKLQGDSQSISRSTSFFSQTLTHARFEIATLKAELQKTQKQALYDSLTGLMNRHAFDSDLTAFIGGDTKGLCLILADIDHFKVFNDHWGHLLGDQVLKSVARKISEHLRDGASAYRFGGEEFVILIPGTKLAIARQFAENLRKIVERLSLKDKRTGEKVKNITLSFGVAEFQSHDSLNSFIDRADTLLYDAKRFGRNRVFPVL